MPSTRRNPTRGANGNDDTMMASGTNSNANNDSIKHSDGTIPSQDTSGPNGIACETENISSKVITDSKAANGNLAFMKVNSRPSVTFSTTKPPEKSGYFPSKTFSIRDSSIQVCQNPKAKCNGKAKDRVLNGRVEKRILRSSLVDASNSKPNLSSSGNVDANTRPSKSRLTLPKASLELKIYREKDEDREPDYSLQTTHSGRPLRRAAIQSKEKLKEVVKGQLLLSDAEEVELGEIGGEKNRNKKGKQKGVHREDGSETEDVLFPDEDDSGDDMDDETYQESQFSGSGGEALVSSDMELDESDEKERGRKRGKKSRRGRRITLNSKGITKSRERHQNGKEKHVRNSMAAATRRRNQVHGIRESRSDVNTNMTISVTSEAPAVNSSKQQRGKVDMQTQLAFNNICRYGAQNCYQATQMQRAAGNPEVYHPEQGPILHKQIHPYHRSIRQNTATHIHQSLDPPLQAAAENSGNGNVSPFTHENSIHTSRVDVYSKVSTGKVEQSSHKPIEECIILKRERHQVHRTAPAGEAQGQDREAQEAVENNEQKHSILEAFTHIKVSTGQQQKKEHGESGDGVQGAIAGDEELITDKGTAEEGIGLPISALVNRKMEMKIEMTTEGSMVSDGSSNKVEKVAKNDEQKADSLQIKVRGSEKQMNVQNNDNIAMAVPMCPSLEFDMNLQNESPTLENQLDNQILDQNNNKEKEKEVATNAQSTETPHCKVNSNNPTEQQLSRDINIAKKYPQLSTGCGISYGITGVEEMEVIPEEGDENIRNKINRNIDNSASGAVQLNSSQPSDPCPVPAPYRHPSPSDDGDVMVIAERTSEFGQTTTASLSAPATHPFNFSDENLYTPIDKVLADSLQSNNKFEDSDDDKPLFSLCQNRLRTSCLSSSALANLITTPSHFSHISSPPNSSYSFYSRRPPSAFTSTPTIASSKPGLTPAQLALTLPHPPPTFSPNETKFRRAEIQLLLNYITSKIVWKEVAAAVGEAMGVFGHDENEEEQEEHEDGADKKKKAKKRRKRTSGSYSSHWKNVLCKKVLEGYPE